MPVSNEIASQSDQTSRSKVGAPPCPCAVSPGRSASWGPSPMATRSVSIRPTLRSGNSFRALTRSARTPKAGRSCGLTQLMLSKPITRPGAVDSRTSRCRSRIRQAASSCAGWVPRRDSRRRRGRERQSRPACQLHADPERGHVRPLRGAGGAGRAPGGERSEPPRRPAAPATYRQLPPDHRRPGVPDLLFQALHRPATRVRAPGQQGPSVEEALARRPDPDRHRCRRPPRP